MSSLVDSENTPDNSRPENLKRQTENDKTISTTIPVASVSIPLAKQDPVNAAIEAEFRAHYDKAIEIEEMILTTPSHLLARKFEGGCRLFNAQTLSGDRYYADELVSQLESDFARRRKPVRSMEHGKPGNREFRFVIVANTNIGPFMLLRRDASLWKFPVHVGDSIKTFGDNIIEELTSAIGRDGLGTMPKDVKDRLSKWDKESGYLFRMPDPFGDVNVNVVPLWLGDAAPPAVINVPGTPEFAWAMCAPDYKETANMDDVDAAALDFLLPGLVNMFEGGMYLFED